VVKWLGTIPAIGVCVSCDRQFKVPMTVMKRVADAQESLRKQFAEHECTRLEESDNVAQIVREGSENRWSGGDWRFKSHYHQKSDANSSTVSFQFPF
jgi:hypothetical protein